MATKSKKTTKKTTAKTTTKTTTKKIKTGTIRSSRYDKKGKRTHKKCSVCGKWQPVVKFYRPEKDCRCKECSGKYAKQLREQKAAAEKKSKRTKKAA